MASASSQEKTSQVGECTDCMPAIGRDATAFSHVPEHGFSLFLANRTKTIHFIRHAEGMHNEANKAYGDDTPCIYSTENAWKYLDARLTEKGIQQCVVAKETLMTDCSPQLIVVSPFTRTLQTAHVMFGGSQRVPFIVHHLCRERWGKYTCDKLRSKEEIIGDMAPIYEQTGDSIDFESFGFPTETDEDWLETREPDEMCTARGIAMMQWLATRPEKEIAIVTHSSWLKHLFRAFGDSIHEKDKKNLHRLAGNAEVRSVCLALHRGFYPEGEWVGDSDTFVPSHPSFRRFRYNPTNEAVAKIHTDMLHKVKNTHVD